MKILQLENIINTSLTWHTHEILVTHSLRLVFIYEIHLDSFRNLLLLINKIDKLTNRRVKFAEDRQGAGVNLPQHYTKLPLVLLLEKLTHSSTRMYNTIKVTFEYKYQMSALSWVSNNKS